MKRKNSDLFALCWNVNFTLAWEKSGNFNTFLSPCLFVIRLTDWNADYKPLIATIMAVIWRETRSFIFFVQIQFLAADEQVSNIYLNTGVQDDWLYSLQEPLCIIADVCVRSCGCVCVSLEQIWSRLYSACPCSSPCSFPGVSVGSFCGSALRWLLGLTP